MKVFNIKNRLLFLLINTMEFINPIARKRFKNEIKLMNEVKDGIPPPFYATGFPSNKPGEELIWYILIKGNDGSDYEGGEYIGKIMHDKEYPNKPPDYMNIVRTYRDQSWLDENLPKLRNFWKETDKKLYQGQQKSRKKVD